MVPLTYIIDSKLKLKHFPSVWKQAIIIPILKPGKNTADLNPYRPIYLLNTLSKEQNQLNIRYNEQFGFQESLSTGLLVSPNWF